MSKLIQCPNANASYRIYSETFPNWVFDEIQLHLNEKTLRSFQVVSWPNFNCILSKIFYDFPQLCLSQKSIASDLISSKISPKCFIIEIQLHFIEMLLILSQICVSWSSNASFGKCSQTFANCVLAETQLHLIEKTLRSFQFRS